MATNYWDPGPVPRAAPGQSTRKAPRHAKRSFSYLLKRADQSHASTSLCHTTCEDGTKDDTLPRPSHSIPALTAVNSTPVAATGFDRATRFPRRPLISRRFELPQGSHRLKRRNPKFRMSLKSADHGPRSSGSFLHVSNYGQTLSNH
jgi:hypothetical protein